MKKIGELSMTFAELRDGVYYSDLLITTEGVTRTITLPRYHPLMGWVEIFGLAPQFEWLVLGDVPAFTKTVALHIDANEFTAQVTYTPKPEKQKHHVEVKRWNDELAETCVFTESYAEAPKHIKMQLDCDHDAGTYTCASTKGLVAVGELHDEEKIFVTETMRTHGETEHIWKKEFVANGSLPPIYYTFFPPISGVDLTNVTGHIVEVGYMAGDTGVDAVHGTWFKRLVVNDQIFYIFETEYSSKTINTPEGDQVVKDTYKKELFRAD